MDTHILQIQKILGIDFELAEEIRAICKPVQFAANTTIQHRGEPDTKAIFLLKGVCKYSLFDNNKKESITYIDQGPEFLSYGFLGFYRKDRAVVNFISITKIEGLEIQSERLMPILDRNPHLYHFLITAMLKRYQMIQAKEISIIQKTSMERYKDFVTVHNAIIDKIPLKDIAAYLNIQPGSLSRIRKNLNA